MFGMPLAQLEKEKGEEAWKAVEGPAKEVGDLLRKNGGPFFLGDRGDCFNSNVKCRANVRQ